jgi:hypothetical protein
MKKAKVKLYRVTAVQPVYHVTYVNATSPKEAEQICEKDMSDGLDVHDWKSIDCGSWYGYRAEEDDKS